MPKTTFTVTVDLRAFFANHKAKVKLFINENIQNVSDLEDKISEIFGIRNYHLICNECLLPSCEDIRVLSSGDVVCATPNEDHEEVKLLDKAFYKKKEKVKKEKRRTTDVEEKSPIVLKKHKKERREAATPPKEDIPVKSPKKSPTIQNKKIKTKDRAVSWSTNPLPNTINHVKIARIPLKKSDTSPEPMDSSTPDSMEKAEDYHPFASVSGGELQNIETTVEYPITKRENPAYPNHSLENNNIEPTPSTAKKETELKNWKHSILEKFTHHLQSSEQNIQDTTIERNEITSTNRDDVANESSSSSVISKVMKLNQASGRIKKKNPARQASGIGYYLKLMDKIGWDSSKSIAGIDTNECVTTETQEKVREEIDFSFNGDSTSDFPTDIVAKRKRKRKHKKRTRAATPIPQIAEYIEDFSSNTIISTPKNHIRFEETLQDPMAAQKTTILDDSSNLEEGKSEENVVILQNLALNSEPKNDPKSESDGEINDQFFNTLDTQPIKSVCEVCEGERSSQGMVK